MNWDVVNRKAAISLKYFLDLVSIIHWHGCKSWQVSGYFSWDCRYIISIDIGSAKIVGSKQVKLLRVTIDRQLTFYPHITSECKRASAKFEALTQNQADHLYMALYHVFF